MSRCGHDTDCNTATAAAVLVIISGYEAIPEVLKSRIPAVAEAGKYEGNRAYLFYTIDLPAGHHKLKLDNSAERNPRSSGNKLYVEKILAYK